MMESQGGVSTKRRRLEDDAKLITRLMETSPIGIITLDMSGAVTFANRRAEEILCLTRNEMSGTLYNAPAWHITSFDGEPFPEEQLPFSRVRSTLQPVFDVRHAIEVAPGDRRFLSINASPLLDDEGRFEGIIATIDDMTAEVAADRARQRAEERVHLIIEAAPFGVHVYELEEKDRLVFVGANPAADRILGIHHSPLIGLTIEQAFPGLEGTPIPDRYRSIALGGEKFEDEQVDYDHGAIRGAFQVIAFNTGRRRMTVFFHDISRRKRAEAENVLLAQTLKSAQDCITITDLDDRLIFVNDAFCRTYGFQEEEVLGKNVSILRPKEFATGRSGEILSATLAGGWHGEILNRRKDGTVFPVEVWTSAVRDRTGTIIAAAGVARDITERAAAQAQIRASLTEKEVLLKEIHHRVKNNMQVVTSLLNLEGEKAGDPATRALFKESMTRIRSMALVHEKLYRSPSLASIEFGEYLNAVSNELMRTYHAPGVSCTVDAEPVSLAIDTAIPCGLIVSELVTNALKHAFPGAQQGMLRIRLRRQDSSTVLLSVSDTGVGFPPGVDFCRAGSMGLSLVRSLTGQIRGTVSLVRDRGTTVTVTFPTSVPS